MHKETKKQNKRRKKKSWVITVLIWALGAHKTVRKIFKNNRCSIQQYDSIHMKRIKLTSK